MGTFYGGDLISTKFYSFLASLDFADLTDFTERDAYTFLT